MHRYVVCLTLWIAAACGEDGPPSTAKELTLIRFTQPVNPALPGDIGLVISGMNALAVAPYGSAREPLIASFAFTGERVEVDGVVQRSGVTPNDFSGGPMTYRVFAEDGSSQDYSVELRTPRVQQAYVKGSMSFGGSAVALSGDGNTLAVGGLVNKVFVYTRTGATWTEHAVLSGSYSRGGFGISVALSADGTTLAACDRDDASAATGIDGNGSDTSAPGSGAVYVFRRAGAQWTQEAYVKASNTEAYDDFGQFALALSGDGNTLAVGATSEDSNATGVGGNQADNSANYAGAAYVFARVGSTWSQQAYVKRPITGGGFAFNVSLSADGNTLAASGGDASMSAAYLFVRSGTTWSYQAAATKQIVDPGDGFGLLSLSGDASTLVATATGAAGGSGAAYIFVRNDTTWTQQAYLKAANAEMGDNFGTGVDIADDGNTVLVGAWFEDSAARGVDGDGTSNAAMDSGAAYSFVRRGDEWRQEHYLKASNTDPGDSFGFNTSAVALSGDGLTAAVGAPNEQSASTTINSGQDRNDSYGNGAVYVFH